MKYIYKSHLNQSGFTIVELLVVIVVIGILAAITIVSYTGISQRATVASLQSDLSSSAQQFKMFQVINSNYPATISSNCSTTPDTNTNKCLKSSQGNSYTIYNVNNNSSPQTFSLTEMNVNGTTMTITESTGPTIAVDSTSPSKVGNVAAAQNGTQSVITWDAATDNVGVTAYRIKQSSSPDMSSPVTLLDTINVLTYTVTGLTNGNTYYFTVAARDNAGNWGSESDPHISQQGYTDRYYIASDGSIVAIDLTASVMNGNGNDNYNSQFWWPVVSLYKVATDGTTTTPIVSSAVLGFNDGNPRSSTMNKLIAIPQTSFITGESLRYVMTGTNVTTYQAQTAPLVGPLNLPVQNIRLRFPYGVSMAGGYMYFGNSLTWLDYSKS